MKSGKTEVIAGILWLVFARETTVLAAPPDEAVQAAGVLIDAGKLDEALGVLADVDPQTPAVLYHRALALARQGDMARARDVLSELDRCAGVAPNLLAGAHHNLGVLEYQAASSTTPGAESRDGFDVDAAIDHARSATRWFRSAREFAARGRDAAESTRALERAQMLLADLLKRKQEAEKQKQDQQQQQSGGENQDSGEAQDQNQNQQKQDQKQEGQNPKGSKDGKQQNGGSAGGEPSSNSKGQSVVEQLKDLAQKQSAESQESDQQAQANRSPVESGREQQKQQADQRELNRKTAEAREQLKKGTESDAAARDEASKKVDEAASRQKDAAERLQRGDMKGAAEAQKQAAEKLLEAARIAEGKSDGQLAEERPLVWDENVARILEKEAKERQRVQQILQRLRGKSPPPRKDW